MPDIGQDGKHVGSAGNDAVLRYQGRSAQIQRVH
jgi:hypothetical protein